MRIESGYLKQDRLCGQKNNRNAVGNFSDAMNKVRESISNKVSTRDSYVNGMDYNNFGIYTKNSISQDVELPIETERYKIEDATYVNGVAAYEIVDKQAGKDFYIREDQLAIQRDEKTGMEFLINMDQPFSYNVTMTSELKNLLNDLSDKRNIDIKEIPLQGGLVVNRDSKTGLNYLSIKGNEAQGVSVIITSDKDIETLNKLADEFQKYPVSSQRSTAGLYALLEISGNLKREKDGFTFLTPNGVTYIPYDGDSSKAWEIDMPGSCYATARKCLAAENDCADMKYEAYHQVYSYTGYELDKLEEKNGTYYTESGENILDLVDSAVESSGKVPKEFKQQMNNWIHDLVSTISTRGWNNVPDMTLSIIYGKSSLKDMNQLITYQYEADRMNRQWYSVL